MIRRSGSTPSRGLRTPNRSSSSWPRLLREAKTSKVAVVLDNAAFHHARALTDMLQPGGQLEGLRLIYLPPYAPDHNPIEHVWNTAKGAIANIQRDDPAKTFTAFTNYITNCTFNYDFEHLPTHIKKDTLHNHYDHLVPRPLYHHPYATFETTIKAALEATFSIP